MAIIKVITPSVTDANITTAKVTDNAITLDKMASGTDGNIISYDASGNPVAIATGSDGQVLTSTGAGSPPAFEAIPGGGKVLQVVQGATTTETSSSSATFADTTLTANITPSATSSKILVLVEHSRSFVNGATQIGLKLFRATSEIYVLRYLFDTNDATRQSGSLSFNLLDAPSSSSQLTYKTQFNNEQATGSVNVQQDGSTGKSTITLIEIGA